MRLTQTQLNGIIIAFKDIFDKNDQIWLFGSRVYDSLKGGDIDLYIETHLTNSEEIFNKKMNFLIKLNVSLEDQKIDVVVNQLSLNKELPIYLEAKTSGIKIYG